MIILLFSIHKSKLPIYSYICVLETSAVSAFTSRKKGRRVSKWRSTTGTRGRSRSAGNGCWASSLYTCGQEAFFVEWVTTAHLLLLLLLLLLLYYDNVALLLHAGILRLVQRLVRRLVLRGRRVLRQRRGSRIGHRTLGWLWIKQFRATSYPCWANNITFLYSCPKFSARQCSVISWVHSFLSSTMIIIKRAS